MKKFTVDYIASSISGEIIQGPLNVELVGVSIDSRTINKSEVFFAIVGDKFDGHSFIEDAVNKGAEAVVVDRDIKTNSGIAVIKVEDTTKALQELAQTYRLSLKNLKVVAVTGSAGKTSTKDMIASLLKLKYSTKKTRGNLNNYYGLPLTLLEFTGVEDIGVLEMGMSQIGEIELLARIAKPDIAVVTNVGQTHLESLGSVENVARGKSELIQSLSKEGIAVLNYDDNLVKNMAKEFYGKKIIYYGLSSDADLYADNIKKSPDKTEITIHYQGEEAKLKIDKPGRHNIYNALAAVAVARIFDLSWSEIQNGFSKIEYSSLRWDVRKKNGITIINDTYNANPLSMKAAIDGAEEIKGSRLLLVLGAMLELGEKEESAHLEIGRHIQNKGIDLLITVGETASLIARGAIKNGMKGYKIKECNNNTEAISVLNEYLTKGDVLLVKGSRSMKMEEVVEELL